MAYWWSPKEGHYEYPVDYEDGKPTNKQYFIDPTNIRLCPKCAMPNLMPDGQDLACLSCGYRDFFYLDNAILNKIALFWRRYSEGEKLRSDREKREADRKHDWYEENKVRMRAKNREYALAHPEETRASILKSHQNNEEYNRKYRHNWYLDHKNNEDYIKQRRLRKKRYRERQKALATA